MADAATWYLFVEMVSTVVAPSPRPVIGPLTMKDCTAVGMAIAKENVPSIANVWCRETKFMTACPVPGNPGSFTACPVFDAGPLAGPPPDRK